MIRSSNLLRNYVHISIRTGTGERAGRQREREILGGGCVALLMHLCLSLILVGQQSCHAHIAPCMGCQVRLFETANHLDALLASARRREGRAAGNRSARLAPLRVL